MDREKIDEKLDKYMNHPVRMYIECRMMDNLFDKMASNAEFMVKDGIVPLTKRIVILAMQICSSMMCFACGLSFAIHHVMMLIFYPVTKAVWVYKICRDIRKGNIDIRECDEID